MLRRRYSRVSPPCLCCSPPRPSCGPTTTPRRRARRTRTKDAAVVAHIRLSGDLDETPSAADPLFGSGVGELQDQARPPRQGQDRRQRQGRRPAARRPADRLGQARRAAQGDRRLPRQRQEGVRLPRIGRRQDACSPPWPATRSACPRAARSCSPACGPRSPSTRTSSRRSASRPTSCRWATSRARPSRSCAPSMSPQFRKQLETRHRRLLREEPGRGDRRSPGPTRTGPPSR